MKLLLKIAMRNSRHALLTLITLINLLFLTVANHAEMIALGLLANTGQDFFTVFGHEKGGYLHPAEQVTEEELLDKWRKIPKETPGVLSKKDAKTYIASKKEGKIFTRIVHFLSRKLDIEKSFHRFIVLLVGIAFFKALMLFSSRFTTQLLSIRLTRDLRMQYFEHIQSLPFRFYQEYNVGSLSSRAVGDAGQIAGSINSCLTNYIQTPFVLISTLIACVCFSWQLSFIIFVALPLIIFPVWILTRKVKGVARELQKNQETFTSVLLDFLSGIQTVKIFSMESFALEKYQEQNQHMAHLESKSAKYSLLTRPFLHTVTTTCLAIVALFGLHILGMSVAELIVFCGFLHMFYEPVKKFSEENANIQRGVVAAERMFDVLNKVPEMVDQKGAKTLRAFHQELTFQNVSFSYQKHRVLHNINFSIKKGQTIALVGPTGAGKSTIAQLMPRLYDVNEGKILIDGLDVTGVTQQSLRDLIAFVPQKPFLFYDTVINNIKIGRKASKQEVIAAAKSAFADEFIEKLPQGYYTRLSEQGKSLSGGEQQRLAIARALLQKCPILVLDEATSSLDSISEEKIKQALLQLQGSVTQIIIAHRLSTIDHADHIIYLDEGRILAQGTKSYLLENCLPFQSMWETYHNSSAKNVATTQVIE
ncbi:MAG: ABC transporter ATP-binding protein [Chlamydiota bacterium]